MPHRHVPVPGLPDVPNKRVEMRPCGSAAGLTFLCRLPGLPEQDHSRNLVSSVFLGALCPPVLTQCIFELLLDPGFAVLERLQCALEDWGGFPLVPFGLGGTSSLFAFARRARLHVEKDSPGGGWECLAMCVLVAARSEEAGRSHNDIAGIRWRLLLCRQRGSPCCQVPVPGLPDAPTSGSVTPQLRLQGSRSCAACRACPAGPLVQPRVVNPFGKVHRPAYFGCP